MRKPFVFILIAIFLTVSASASSKITVQQLGSLLSESHQEGKSDEAVATKLKDLELTEQLTIATMNSFTQYDPGPYTVTQIRILGVDSALLPPPASDLPSDAAPDSAAQAAILSSAVDYAAHSYADTPKLAAEKQTIRFQNGVTNIQTNSGRVGSGNPGEMNAVNPYLLMLGAHTATIESDHGVELAPQEEKQKDPASQYGQISQGGGGLALGVILTDAAKGTISWLRWETVNGKKRPSFLSR